MIAERDHKTILSPQKGGFLTNSAMAFTHTLNAYTGCGFGATSCGAYCYAQFMPNWTQHLSDHKWGHAVVVKRNAPDLLRKELTKLGDKRPQTRIFMSSITDPYQPLENHRKIKRQLLEVFADFPDVGLLIIQTRSDLVLRDVDLIAALPYAWVSMTIETDRQDVLHRIAKGGISVERRLAAVHQLRENDIGVQIAVSPCLPYTPDFASKLVNSGANRIIVDTHTDGDGQGGNRSAKSPFAAIADFDWRDDAPARQLYADLAAYPVDIGWSADGFCGIPSYRASQTDA